MRIIYTKHAEDKLKSPDAKRFKITKSLIKQALSRKYHVGKTKYGEYAALLSLGGEHVLRVIYDLVDSSTLKVITFHIARKGRYEA